MRNRWFSKRAMFLHLAVLLWTPSCLLAGWWQVTRALDGNGLSYLYSVEWPIFALVGIAIWWVQIHTDPDTVGARAQRKLQAQHAQEVSAADAPARQLEDEELAAYNDRLQLLALEGNTKTWRHSRMAP